MKNSIITIAILISFNILGAQNCPMDIGTNFGGIDSQVFKDLKKTSTHFFTENIVYLAGDSNYWDTHLIDSIPTDVNGYPIIDIPFEHSSVDTSQMLHFLAGQDDFCPAGHYYLDFDGTGVLDISPWSNASNITFPTANRIEFDIVSGSIDGIHIEIKESLGTDYVRNITIVHEDDLASFHSQPFRPELVALSKDFECLRYMDWMGTNFINMDTFINYDTTVLTWNNRIQKGQHRIHDEDGGMSYEHIIEFSNEVDKNVWINIPHLADSNYIYQLAKMFRDDLNNDLDIYVEFSNEVWNLIFQQSDYVQYEGPYAGDLPRNYAWYSTKMFKIFEDVFGTERNRLKFVMAGLDWSLIDAVPEAISLGADIDYVSYPGYFNLGDSTGWANMDALGASATVADIINQTRSHMADDFYWLKEFKELVCDANDIDFIMYEGGQHLLRTFGVEESFQQALYDAQLDDGMYDLYQELLSFCRDTLEVKLFNHYILYGPNESTFGSWGMVESVFETPNTPKYNALMSFKCENDTTETPIDTTETSLREMSNLEISVFPNPTTGNVNISFQDNFEGNISIISLNGQILFEEKINSNFIKIDLSKFSKGMYFVNGISNNKSFKKILIKK